MPRATDEKPGGDAVEQKETSQPKRGRRFRRSSDKAAETAQRYLDALDNRDLDGAMEYWAPGGLERISGIGEFRAPDELRQFFEEMFGAMPDGRFEIIEMVSQDDKVAVRWRNTGTFCGSPFQGIQANGARVELEGLDLFTVADGKIQSNDVYQDGMQFARQIGMLPRQDSAAERGMTRAFNLRTRARNALGGSRLERVAEGVWLIRGGFPKKSMNVYLIEEDGGVIAFDAGIEAMTSKIAQAASSMGGLRRVVLGHGHPDHRGAAPGLGVPVFCHPDEVADTEGDGGAHYFDFSKLERWTARALMPRFLKTWDGGPVTVAGTLSEGDRVAGFEVVHLPGHAPGLIALWRESDRLALASDAFYTLDPQTGRYGAPRVPHRAFNQDTEQARASMRKLADLEPAAAWAGHAQPLRGDVANALRQAAETT